MLPKANIDMDEYVLLLHERDARRAKIAKLEAEKARLVAAGGMLEDAIDGYGCPSDKARRAWQEAKDAE